MDQNTVTIVERAWFWVALVLMLLICCLLLLGGYYYNKQRKPVVVYEPNEQNYVKSASHQDIELAVPPVPAYVDNDIAKTSADGLTSQDEGDGDELKLEEAEVEEDGQPTLTSMGSTAMDPAVNPNLKQNPSTVSAISIVSVNAMRETDRGTDTGAGIPGSPKLDGENKENDDGGDGDELALVDDHDRDRDHDHALDMIAGPAQATGYKSLKPEDDEDEDVDEDEEMYEQYTTPKDNIFSV